MSAVHSFCCGVGHPDSTPSVAAMSVSRCRTHDDPTVKLSDSGMRPSLHMEQSHGTGITAELSHILWDWCSMCKKMTIFATNRNRE